MMTPTRDSPRSSSSLAPLRLPKTAAVLLLLLLALAAGRTNACTVNVDNQYNVSLSVITYDGGDSACVVSYGYYMVAAGKGTASRSGAPGSAWMGWAACTNPIGPIAYIGSLTCDPNHPLRSAFLRSSQKEESNATAVGAKSSWPKVRTTGTFATEPCWSVAGAS